MGCLYLVLVLCFHEAVCVQANSMMIANDKSDFSPLTSSNSSRDISSMLGDVLNRESVVRLSMVQVIQGLVKDVLDNRKSSAALKTKLNDQQKEMTRKLDDQQKELTGKLNDQEKEITRKLNDQQKELIKLSDNQRDATENTQKLNDMNKTISKNSNAFRLQLQKYDLQLLNISSQLLSVHLKLLHKSCMEILQNDPDVKGKDGVYSINVDDQEKKVYCDMTTDGGGWTVIQKREDGSTDFYRKWTDYKNGFGDPFKNYWIGNDAIHTLTIQDQELRVDLQAFDNQTAYALYSKFKVGNESTKYRLTVGGYSGTAGNSLRRHNGHKFSTRDQDNDVYIRNCAVLRRGAWWYKDCTDSNLNGQYTGSAISGTKYPYWGHWKSTESLKKTVMMIRPKS